MDLIRKYVLTFRIGVAAPLLSGCYSPGFIDEQPEYTITGTVTQPDGFQGLLQRRDKLSEMISSAFPEINNLAVQQRAVVEGVTVELVEMHDSGYQEFSLLPNESTTDSRGRYWLTSSEKPSSKLVLRAGWESGNGMRALAVAGITDINVYSEYAYLLIIEQVRSNPDVFLPYFSGIEVENILASIEELNVDLTNATSVNSAINLINMVDAGVIANEVARASTPNLEGRWLYVKKSGANSCGFPLGAELIRTEISVTQINDALTIYVDGAVFSTGTLFGRDVIGIELETYPENGGTMVQSSSAMTVATDGESVDGSISWDWFGSDSSCSGVDVVSVTREVGMS